MPEVVIVEAARSPFAKRWGGLSGMHSIDALAQVQRAVVARAGIDPGAVGQVVGGCVGQVGMQTGNITRTAWLAAGLPLEVAATTVDSQCGSSQQAMNLAYAMVASGVIDAAVACGVELMSRVPMGSTIPKDPDVGKPVNRTYRNRYEWTSQFQGAEMIAQQWGITRDDCDEFAKLSQDRAGKARANGHFEAQIVPMEAPVPGDAEAPPRLVDTDEGPRETTLEGLAALKPTLGPDGIHTAGSSSQISDGASAVLLTTEARADELGLRARARVVDVCLAGSDPVLMLTGPIPATTTLLARTGLGIDDIDVVEINEAFASVVLAWSQELGADMGRVNPNGGAIALGHPLGATGTGLVTKAVHELERAGGRRALVTMCCGGGLGTGTVLERV
jgi:acetyl-CoA C-acetyltransferase